MLKWIERAITSIFRVISAVLFTLFVTSWVMNYLATGCTDGALRVYNCTIGETDVSMVITDLSWIAIFIALLWIPFAITYGTIQLITKAVARKAVER